MNNKEIYEILEKEFKSDKFKAFAKIRQYDIDYNYLLPQLNDYIQDINVVEKEINTILNSEDFKDVVKKNNILKDNLTSECLSKLKRDGYIDSIDYSLILYATRETWQKIGHEVNPEAVPIEFKNIKYIKEIGTGITSIDGREIMDKDIVKGNVQLYNYSDTWSSKALLEMFIPKNEDVNDYFFTENENILRDTFEDTKPDGYTIRHKDDGMEFLAGLCNITNKTIDISTRLGYYKEFETMLHEFAHAIFHENSKLESYQEEIEVSLFAYFVAKDLELRSQFPMEASLKYAMSEMVGGQWNKHFVDNLKEFMVRPRLYAGVFSRHFKESFEKNKELHNNRDINKVEEVKLINIEKDIEKNKRRINDKNSFICIDSLNEGAPTTSIKKPLVINRDNKMKFATNKSLVINKGKKSNKKNKI